MNSRTSRLCSVLMCAHLLWCCQPAKEDDSKTRGPLFSENIRSTPARTPEEEMLGFHLPPGFEIQLFASEPNIDKPINMTFDAQGRLWVTQSFEYPFPAAQGVKGSDRLTILEDTDGDGKADRFTDFADTLNIPIGVLPITGATLAFSVPSVYRFADTDDDGKPESKSFMLGPFGYQDTHGMVSNFVRGYDGWVHACHGFTNQSRVAGSDGDSIRLVSGNTFRFRLDGSRVEQVTFGQVNPFGLAYDRYGYIYSTDSHSSPLYQLISGGDYPHFGKVEIMGFAPDMKPFVDEATALCGIATYADTKFPEEFHHNFFIGDVVNSRVHRYSVTWKGSSPVGKSETDFIKSEDPWFRPVNIKLGPDGALYVADFYNAIIGHYEVPLGHPKRDKSRGRIWRITYNGHANKKTDLTKATTQELISALDLDNLTTRMAATDQLTDRIGTASVEALKATLSSPETSTQKYIHSSWALHRLNQLADDVLRNSLASKDPLVRLHALRVLVEKKPDPGFYDVISKSLNDADPHVQRVAVELLMKFPTIASVEALLKMLRGLPPGVDTHLIYTSRLCLRNLVRNDGLLKEVMAKSWSAEDAGFLAGVMVDVPSAASALFLSDYMKTYKLPRERIPPAYQQIARFISADQLESVIDHALKEGENDITGRSLIYKGLLEGENQRGGKINPRVFEKWAPGIAEGLFKKFPPNDLTDSDEKVMHQRVAIDIAGDYKVRSLEPVLKGFLEQGHTIGMTIRAAALRSLMKIDLQKNAALGGNIVQNDSVVEYKRRVIAVMGEFPGNPVNGILDGVKNIPPGLQGSIAMALAGSAEGKEIIFMKIKRGEIMPRTLLEPRVEERVLLNASRQHQKEFADLTANLDPVSKEKQALIDQRLMAFELLDKSTIHLDSGRMVFVQNCGMCHKSGGQLGVGPQLDRIGKTGAPGLVEKVLDPNRNISLAFKNYSIRLKDGGVRNGLYRRDEGEVKIYADLTGKEFSVARKNIAEERLSKYTLMPDTFGSTLSEKEFNQLLNYLLRL